MRKFLKRLFRIVVCLLLAVILVRFAPNIAARLFGSGNTQWISERLTETLREKNELIVYEVELTGNETFKQDAWLIGTVQKIEMPYEFQMRFTVDLSQAQVEVVDNVIEVRIPAPCAGYAKLNVNEGNVKKSDWLYPLTPERYAQLLQELEDRLFEECAANAEYQTNAWNRSVYNLEMLFSTVAQQSLFGATCEIRVIQIP